MGRAGTPDKALTGTKMPLSPWLPLRAQLSEWAVQVMQPPIQLEAADPVPAPTCTKSRPKVLPFPSLSTRTSSPITTHPTVVMAVAEFW